MIIFKENALLSSTLLLLSMLLMLMLPSQVRTSPNEKENVHKEKFCPGSVSWCFLFLFYFLLTPELKTDITDTV